MFSPFGRGASPPDSPTDHPRTSDRTGVNGHSAEKRGLREPRESSANGDAANRDSEATQDLPAKMARIIDSLRHLKPQTDLHATQFVAQMLEFAREVKTSDVHLQPTATGLSVLFRNNGVLQKLGEFQIGSSKSIVARLKVIANLLTYQSEIPQEGRITDSDERGEVRVSTFPTLYGERAVLRFFGHAGQYKRLSDLGHADDVTASIQDCLAETSGAVIVSGPAGSGKSTTLFACLRELVDRGGGHRSLLAIEDPIEVPIDGVSQSQVNKAAGFDLHVGLRSLLRQDPEVIMIGEIRDALTAEIAIQACLTGQLMLTTFHADSASTAISRLIDLGVEPYLLRSGLLGVLSQRLLRTLCDCAVDSSDANDFYGLPIDHCRTPAGCPACNSTGYQGRVITSEFLSLRDSSLADQVVGTRDSRAIYRLALQSGMKSLWERSTELVRQGRTSPAEVRRVLGVAMRI